MNTKKLLALLLALVMILCAMPVVYAAVDDPALKDDSDVSIPVEDLPTVVVLYGDADGDGEVSVLDATAILKNLAGWDVTISVDAADADGDGEVSVLDATAILKNLAGWDVPLGSVS